MDHQPTQSTINRPLTPKRDVAALIPTSSIVSVLEKNGAETFRDKCLKAKTNTSAEIWRACGILCAVDSYITYTAIIVVKERLCGSASKEEAVSHRNRQLTTLI